MSYPPRNNTRDVYTMGDKRRQKVLDMGRSKSFGQVNGSGFKMSEKVQIRKESYNRLSFV